MDHITIIFPPERLQTIIQTANEGSLEAQYVCWDTFWLHMKSDPYLAPDPELLQYVAPVIAKAYSEGEKLESFLPFYKDRDKYKKRIQKLYLIAKYIQTIENIIKADKCNRGDAEQRLVEIVNNGWDSATLSEKKLLQQVFTLDKLRNELRYYDKYYPQWAFYFVGLVIEGLSFLPRVKGKVQIPA